VAVRNPWLRQKQVVPRYEKPPEDPIEAKFRNRMSVSFQAKSAVDSFKERVAKQRGRSPDDIYIAPEDYMNILEPYIMSRKLGEVDADYQRRADSAGMLSKMDSDIFIKKQMGYLGGDRTKNRMDLLEKEMEQARQAAEVQRGQTVELRPFLVNISWVFRGSTGAKKKRGSPPVRYSIEGVFYGWDEELTLAEAQRMMWDHVVDHSSYKAKNIMDFGDLDFDGEAMSSQVSGIMEVPETIRKRFGADMSDENFETKFTAFFKHENNKTYEDKDFGYRDTPLKYRWSGSNLEKI